MVYRNVAKRVALYLKGIVTLKLEMAPARKSRDALQLEANRDAEFTANKKDRKSLTGGAVLLNGITVSWTAKKQGGVSSFCAGYFRRKDSNLGRTGLDQGLVCAT